MLALKKLWIFVTLVVSVGRARAQDADRTFCFDITSCKDCLDRSCAWAPVAGCLSSCWDIADTACYSPDRYSASEVCDKPVEPETGLWWPAATAAPTELDELDPSECPKGKVEGDSFCYNVSNISSHYCIIQDAARKIAVDQIPFTMHRSANLRVESLVSLACTRIHLKKVASLELVVRVTVVEKEQYTMR